MRELELIALYYYVCERYIEELGHHCQRFSNNCSQQITDEELLSIYLYCQMFEDKHQLKQIYDYARRYLHSWFPGLPAYATFVTRINRMSVVFPLIAADMIRKIDRQGVLQDYGVMDSFPIMLCRYKRPGKVGSEFADIGYCPVKGTHYWGVKLHLLGHCRPGTLPLPAYLFLSPASVSDLSAMRPYVEELHHFTLFADKAYWDRSLMQRLVHQNAQLHTPVKYFRGQSLSQKCRDKAADKLYSAFVSKIKQPIESLFNWLNEKVNLQNASKVRSNHGLIVHVFGKIAAAFATLIFNP